MDAKHWLDLLVLVGCGGNLGAAACQDGWMASLGWFVAMTGYVQLVMR
jgi:hypothetical protein